MKKKLHRFLSNLLFSGLLILTSFSARAAHIIGMDLQYSFVSSIGAGTTMQSTYNVIMTVYGDCSAGTFYALACANPEICVYNAGTSVTSLRLTIQAPTAGALLTPICPADSLLTTCNIPTSTIPGVKKYIYIGTVTLTGTSHYWRFIFNGDMGQTAGCIVAAGRQATITNINNPGASIVALLDTLDNTYFQNTSATLNTPPTSYYCLNNNDSYNPNGTDPNGDILGYHLIAGQVGNGAANNCNWSGAVVAYVGAGINATNPITCLAGTYSFDTSSGYMTFDPNVAQRSMVVYNVDEYRNDTFVGTSQREMVVLVQTCPGSIAATGAIYTAAGAGTLIDSVHYNICSGMGTFTLTSNPIDPNPTTNIYVSAVGLPTGSTFTVVNDSTNHPIATFAWTSTGVPPGSYTFYIVLGNSDCPVSALNSIPITVIIGGPTAFTITPPTSSFCTGYQMLTVPPLPATIATNTFLSTGAFTVPDNSTPGISNTITVAGIPAGATILDAQVELNSVTMQRDGQLAFNILAPSLSNLNLIDQRGGNTANFTNTIFSSLGGAVVATAIGPFSNTYAADAVNAAGPTTAAWTSNVTTWPPLFTTPNGPWLLCGRDYVAMRTATVNQWSLTLHYSVPSTGGYSWLPATGLYTNAALTTPYVAGAYTNTVYASPGATITYTATAHLTGYICTTSNTATVTYTGATGGISGINTICPTQTTTLSIAASGGTWTSGSPTIATVNSTTGVVTGVAGGTALISYNNGCVATYSVVVSAGAGTLTAPISLCPGATATLSSTLAGGTWTSGSPGVATVTAGPSATTTVSAIAGLGTSVITYSLGLGCVSNTTVTVNALPLATTGTMTVCAGSTTILTNTTAGGGTWTSGTPGVATVTAGPSGSTTVSGVSATGSATSVITFTSVSTSCITTSTVTVTPVTTAISGPALVCPGSTINLSDPIPGGTWSSGTPTVATVVTGPGAGAGVVSGVSGGTSFNTSVITYSNGCGSASLTVSVTAAPIAAISGPTVVCSGSQITLSNAITGGTWTSGSPANATVTAGPGAAGGVVSGITPGTTTLISYNTGCGAAANITILIYGAPTTITAPTYLCTGTTATLSNNGTPTGTWSSGNPSVATIDPVTGDVMGGGTNGTTTITATNICGSTGTSITAATPSPITGVTSFCQNATTILSDATTGGTWSSGNPAIASASGIINDGTITGSGLGTTAGCTPISYTLSSGCITITTVCTTPAPTGITGSFTICVGQTTSLTDGTTGGVWTSSNGNANVISGTVTGMAAGTSVISYSIGVCGATATVTVNPVPTGIVVPSAVCVNANITLSDAVPSGNWSSNNTNVNISATGVVTGVTTGTSIITYQIGAGCYTTTVVTVSPSPGSITGPSSLCVGSTISLTDNLAGGTWSSSNGAVAPIGLNSGVLTGHAPGGLTTITYTMPVSGCSTTTVVTVNSLPSAVVGPSAMCTGTTATISSTPIGGTWMSFNPVAASVDINGVVTAGVPGTALIVYTLPTGCTSTTTITVNQSPVAITGNHTVCAGAQTTLSDSPTGGIWTASNNAATIGSVSGIVTGSSTITSGSALDTMTFTVAGCSAQITVTVNPLPGIIVGPNAVCVGSSISLTDNTIGGAWSSNSPVASIVSGTGILTGNAPGGTALITVTMPTGCSRSQSVTVNTLPAAITGNTMVCAGLTIQLSDATPGGTWSSSNTNVASIGTSSGTVTGGNVLFTSIDTITYKQVTGCSITATITVNPLPIAIVGSPSMCSGLTTQLSDGTPGGVWSSSTLAVASVNAAGLVTGGLVIPPSTAQHSVITYSLTATGCITQITVTVNPLPGVITGNTTLCAGSTTILSNAVGGGVWTSNNSGIAPINGSSGVINGQSPGGTATITYTIGSGCIVTTTVLVNPLPAPITGTDTVCSGFTTQLSDITTGGVWSSSSAVIAAVGGGTGLVTGGVLLPTSVAQHAVMTYSLTTTGCLVTTTVTVNPPPAAIAGLSSVCEGATINLSDAITGGAWSSSNNTVASVVGAGTTGFVTGGSTGGLLTAIDTITYTLGTGCLTTKTITVNIQPAAITGGPLSICNHSCASLSDATGLGVWTTGNASIATVDATGLVCGSMPGAGIGGGTTAITYTIASCRSATSVFVNPQPVAITGITSMCQGASVTLSDATPGGGWSASNNNATVAPSIGGGFVTGVTPGIDTITYTIGTCIATTTVMVNVQPGPITGVTSFCNTSNTTLSDATPGGIWTSSNISVATVGSLSGIVTGDAPFLPAVPSSTTITYTELAGGCFAARVVTINPQPSPISGPTQVCNGLTIQLSDATPGAAWGVTPSSVSVISISSTGLVTGLSAGIGVIKDSIGICAVTSTVTVNPLPSVITGSFYICEGSQTTLGDLTPGGQWTSSTLSIATVGVSGSSAGTVHAQNTLGTTTITYTLPTTCIATHTLTVIAIPSAINPLSLSVCQGLTEQLSDFTNGGIWSTSNVAVASIGSSSGIVTGGNSSGTVVISYTLGTGCNVVAPLVVNPLSPVTGITTVCVGQTTNLSDTTIGGTWSSVNPLVATVNPVTGVVYGHNAGSTVIIYNLSTGCSASTTVTVLPLPLPITGITTICDGGTTTLSDASLGGAWNSSNPAVAAIDPATGIVTAGPSGITTVTIDVITYQQGGCPITTTLTVNPLPGAIAGNTNICLGLTTALSDPTPGGTWMSDNTIVATVDVNGVVTGNLTGTANIIYTIGTGCTMSIQVTVNPLPGAIGGIDTVCVGSCTQLSDAPVGGAWFSGTPSVATVGFVNGLVCGVSAGTSVITYQIVTGCIMTTTVVVNPLPSSISGSSSVCAGSTTNLFSGPGSGVWSSSNMSVATIDASGVVYGVSAGTTLISFTLGTGCASTLLMTVNPLPAPITGINTVCIGLTTQLFDATPGGTWSSANPIIASVDPNTGVVYGGGSVGATTMIYILPTGCSISIPVIVNNPPVAITGPSQVCVGLSINLVDPGVPGGSWSSSNNGIATIDPNTGEAWGVAQGTVIITYTMGGGSCFATYFVTVNPLPTAIIGVTSVCAGLTTSLSDASLGGAWTSLSPAVATIDPSGTVYGITAGTTVIVYTLPTTCSISAVVIVNPLPAPITGNTNVCLQNTRTLSDSPAPGLWSSGSPTIATVDATTGVVYGVNVGTDMITYTLTLTGCIMTTTIAVHPLPGVFTVTGGGSYCAGTGGVHVGLSGSEIGVLYLLYLGSTPVGTYAGTGSALDFGAQVPGGVYTVIATNTFTTCSITMTGSATVTITPTVVPTVSISANPGDTVCAGTMVIYTPVTTHGGTGPMYQWSVNGLNVSTVTTYNFVPANGDVVRVILTSDTVCAIPDTATALIKMTVLNSVTPAVGMLVSPGDTVCVGNPVTFTAVPSFGGTAPVYQWMVNSSLAYTPGPVYTYVPLDGDVVFVNMVSNYQCRLATTVSSNSVTIKVDSPVIPLVTITARPGAVISVGQTDTLTAVVTHGVGAIYQWSIGGIPVPGATNATFVSNHFSYPRPDSVTCEVINTGACNEHTLAWIYIQVYPEGVTQISGNLGDLNVIPNPNKGIFTIKGTLGTIPIAIGNEEVTIELTDVLGQVMYKGKVIAKGGVMDQQVSLGANIANGMYMLNVHSDSGSKVFHVVVEQ